MAVTDEEIADTIKARLPAHLQFVKSEGDDGALVYLVGVPHRKEPRVYFAAITFAASEKREADVVSARIDNAIACVERKFNETEQRDRAEKGLNCERVAR